MEQETILKIVLAEDEDLIRNNLIKKIEGLNLGFKVIDAVEDGKSALESIKQHQPDLVITDIRMPIMDGIELVKLLNVKFSNIKKMILSGYSEFQYAQQAISSGVNEYLLKPVKINELQLALQKIKASIKKENEKFSQDLKLIRTQEKNPEEIVQLIQHYLKTNFKNEFNWEEISKGFNFTSAYLSKIFVKYTGEPPSRYLINVRINEARYLLTHQKDLTIKEVGELVGYGDQFYFSRIFKQVTGFSPKEFQNSPNNSD